MATRVSKKIAAREPSVGFSLRSFDSNVVMAEFDGMLFNLKSLADELFEIGPDGKTHVNQEVQLEGRKAFSALLDYCRGPVLKPFHAKENQSKISRMSRSIGSDIFGVDYEAKTPTQEWIVIQHDIQEKFSFPWQFAGSSRKEGESAIETLQKLVERRFGTAGFEVIRKDGKVDLYYGFASSASHQKNEKLVMALASSMEKHERAIWFTLTKEEFLKLSVNGAAIWKMRANILRPIRREMKTASGRVLTLNDIGLYPDIVVNRHIENCRTVGILNPEDQSIFFDAPQDIEKTMADGSIVYTGKDGAEDLGPLEQWGQTTSYGVKGCGADIRSCIDVASALESKPIPNNLKPILMGEGCWKFDKIGVDWNTFVARVNELAANGYPSLNKLYLLREADELEGEVRIRRLTRSLIQQWIHMDSADIRKMTSKSRKALRRMKTMKGALNSLTEIGKPEDQRSEVSKVFLKAPWLILIDCVQQYLRVRFEKKRNEAAANKLRTDGSYPYIQEDLVAVAQIWVFGADPNRMDLGVLKAGEISVPDTEERKVLAVRFPANYQTAAVRMNKACVEEFASCPGVCMISFYDDILIRQDGDVDGDEMAIILNDIAIEATEQMYAEFNPPVINFAHGSKAEKVVIGTESHLIETMYDDLWKAKKFDGVGKYANLATLCCHLASVAYAEGRMTDVRIHLNQMSLASTGAILAIDQVKGNAVSDDLIERLESISKSVAKICRDIYSKARPDIQSPNRPMPYTQQFVKGLPALDCLPESVSLCDQIAGLVMRDAGEFEMNTGNTTWNKVEAKRALCTFGNYRVTAVRKAPVIGSVLNQLSNNWFNDRNPADKAVFDAIRANQPVSQKELLTLLWRNACALEFRMEGENLVEKRKEYMKVCKEILYSQALSTKWVSKDGHVFTDVEKKFSVVNSAVSDALNLSGSGNGIDYEKTGSYAMFVLKMFAKEICWTLDRNNPDSSLFCLDQAELDETDDGEELYSDDIGEYDDDEDVEFSDEDFYDDCDIDYYAE